MQPLIFFPFKHVKRGRVLGEDRIPLVHLVILHQGELNKSFAQSWGNYFGWGLLGFLGVLGVLGVLRRFRPSCHDDDDDDDAFAKHH